MSESNNILPLQTSDFPDVSGAEVDSLGGVPKQVRLLQKIEDDKAVGGDMHPMDKLNTLHKFAMRDNKPNTANLLDTLMTIIDRLHDRICNLEEANMRR
jgi:hypothetical protein